MAGDWIKMRPSLLTNPKVNGIARLIENRPDVGRMLSTGFNGCMDEIVTRNVMRNVTVASLLVIWGAANEHTKDGVFRNADLSDIDDMVGIPGFGDAMVSVGWAIFDDEQFTVTLPNFNEYNTCGGDRSATAKTAAQRQKEYRERKKSQNSDVTSDVTCDVTSNRREEKRREELKPSSPDKPDDGFAEFWKAYPRKVGKGAALKAWGKIKAKSINLQVVLNAIAWQRNTDQWTKDGGQFIPHPSTWLNEQRWLDEEPKQSAPAIPFDRAAYEAKRKADAEAAKERMRQEQAEFMRAKA